MNTILDLAGDFKKVAATSGGEFAGACPRCGGTDRFRVWPANGETGRFMCRQCGWTGDGIQFIKDTLRVSYIEACAIAGIAPRQHPDKPRQNVPAKWTPKPSVLPGGKWTQAAEAFVSHAAEVMEHSEDGQAYAASRGLKPETIKALHIGWNPSDLYQDREAWGLSPETNPSTGKARRVWLPRGLVLPTLNGGKFVSVKIRRDLWTPEDYLPKYANVVGGHTAPMVLAPGKKKPVVVVESEIDAILIAQEARDMVAAVAMRSAQNKPDNYTNVWLVSGPVLVALDKDEAGAEGAKFWRKHFPNAKRWPVPVGHDVGDIASVPGLIRAWVRAGITAPRTYVQVPPAPTEGPKLRDPVELAAGVPCPYDHGQLEALAVSHPDLICCPATRPRSWWWRERSWCPQCKTPCSLGVTNEQ